MISPLNDQALFPEGDGATYLYKISLKKVGMVSERERRPLCGPTDSRLLLAPLFAEADRELFIVLALDARNRPIGTNITSIGTLSASLVHPREVFKFAILANAASIILAHNHPSGDTKASADDLSLTKRLRQVGDLMGIEVLDHIIFGDTYSSLREQGAW